MVGLALESPGWSRGCKNPCRGQRTWPQAQKSLSTVSPTWGSARKSYKAFELRRPWASCRLGPGGQIFGRPLGRVWGFLSSRWISKCRGCPAAR